MKLLGQVRQDDFTAGGGACELAGTVLAWMCIDKLKLDEAGEISRLASVRNKYNLKRLQEAALIHDSSSRKP